MGASASKYSQAIPPGAGGDLVASRAAGRRAVASKALPGKTDGETVLSIEGDDEDTGLTAGTRDHRWSRVCRIDDIPRLGARVVRLSNGPNIAVFRTESDKLFALADRCPHRGGPLSQGIVFGDRVACPLHNTCVELDSGCAVAPDKGQVRTYAVKVDDEMVYVDVDVHADAQP